MKVKIAINGDIMMEINFELPITYKYASLEILGKNENYVTKYSEENVLLLVAEGVLRFSENGEQKELGKGEYYIQRKGQYYGGEISSDSPKYFCIHFEAEWTQEHGVFPCFGRFDYSSVSEIIAKINTSLEHHLSYNELQYLFLKLLIRLKEGQSTSNLSYIISEYVYENLGKISSLSDICREFHYSKNYVIQIFKKEFGVSPIQYINNIRIGRAMYLLKSTSKPIKEIAEECGYFDYPYFYKRFIRKTGLSPQKWREKYK